jgi:hypothetical protein
MEKIFLKENEMTEFNKLQEKINQVIYSMGEVTVEKQILFSSRCFKQRGAVYTAN